jgi:hypothetical protein
MYSTTLTQASQATSNKFKEILKMKLSYEWKKLYRIFALQDTAGTGSVSLATFEKASVQNGVYLSKEELNRLNKLYPSHEDPSMINYLKMSVDLGMHLQSFDFLMKNQSRQHDI